MIRIVSTRTLKQADVQIVELHDRAETLRRDLATEKQAAQHAADFLIRAEDNVERLHKQLLAAQDDAARARG
ncbi:hypothetical protein ACFU98_42530, partial [Streptomyces sp. NPDC057575]